MGRPTLVHRLCSLYPGEFKQTLKFVLIASLTFAATYGINTLMDGLFLDHVGANGLPIVYFCTSIGCLLLASPTLQALTHFSARKLFCLFAMGGTFLFGLGSLLLLSGAGGMTRTFWYLCSIACEGYLIIMYTQTWAFVDHCFDLHQAKRLYGLFHASALLGASGGSMLITLLVPWCSPAAILALFGCILLVVLGLAINTKPSLTLITQQLPEAGQRLPLGDFVRQILRSKYVIYLLTFNTTMLLLQVITEYNYLASLQRAFVGTEHSAAIAVLIGKCRAWVYLGMALFGALLYSPMIRRLGLRRSIVIPPLYFVTLFAVWLFGDSLVMGVLGIIAVEGVLAGMEDSNFHLMVNSVDPNLKAKLRVTAEQVLEPAAMLVGSSLLLICQHGSKVMGLVLSALALGVVLLLRAALPSAARTTVPSTALPGESLDGRLPQHVA